MISEFHELRNICIEMPVKMWQYLNHETKKSALYNADLFEWIEGTY